MNFVQNIDFRFFKRPFLVMAIALFCGILLGFDLPDNQLFYPIIISLVSLSITCLILFYIRKVKLFLPFTFIVFLLVGFLLICSRSGLAEKDRFEKIYSTDKVLIVELTGVDQNDKEWRKMTGIIRSLKDGVSNRSLTEPVVMYVQTEGFMLSKGDVIAVASEVEKIRNAGNPGEFNTHYFWRSKGVEYMSFVGAEQFKLLKHVEQGFVVEKLDRISNYLKSSLTENLKGDELAIALALILGDKSLLDVEVKNSFTNTGAMHVLAVSGLHVGIIMQILMFFLGRFPRVISRKSAVVIVVVIMWIYAILTGLSASVLRAVFMFSILVLSQLTERNYDAINTLFFTGFALCLWDPFTLFDIGFQLSFLAMLGIFLFYKPIEKWIYFENKWLLKIWQGTAIGFAAQLMTTPLSLYYFHQFPNYFVLTNIGLMASSGIILGAGIFIFAFKWLRPLAKLTGVVLTFSIFLSLAFIRWVESLPGGVAYGFELSLYAVLLMAIAILLLFLAKLSKPWKYVLYSSSMLLICSSVYSRYTNMRLNELCVLNLKQPAFIIKNGADILCFYDAKREGFEKVKFAVESYQKLYPGDVKYFSLDKNWQLNNSTMNVQIENRNDSKLISINGNCYTLILRNSYNSNVPTKTTLIAMPWVKVDVDYSLTNGAFRTLI